jgi:alpha-L-fucosidase
MALGHKGLNIMGNSKSSWTNPLAKKGVVPETYSESTPFVFRDRLYRLENFRKQQETPEKPVEYRFHEDGFRIRDVELNRVISVPLLNHYFGTAFVWEDRVYAFAGYLGEDDNWWHIRRIVMISSNDLITWSAPKVAIESERGERIFNNGVCHDGDRFVMLYETDDERWPSFTFKYCQSQDLVNWERIPDAFYGVDKYVGGPALYHEGGWYYTLYVEALPDRRYETRVTRSKDLLSWEDAPEDRPFLAYDYEHRPDPIRCPDIREISASDAELCEYRGKTLVYFNGGDQLGVGDLQLAEYEGLPRNLLEAFFKS